MSDVLEARYYNVSDEAWHYIKFYGQPIDTSYEEWDEYVSYHSKESEASKRVAKEYSNTPLYFYGKYSELQEALKVLLISEKPNDKRIKYYSMILGEWERRKYRYVRFEN